MGRRRAKEPGRTSRARRVPHRVVGSGRRGETEGVGRPTVRYRLSISHPFPTCAHQAERGSIEGDSAPDRPWVRASARLSSSSLVRRNSGRSWSTRNMSALAIVRRTAPCRCALVKALVMMVIVRSRMPGRTFVRAASSSWRSESCVRTECFSISDSEAKPTRLSTTAARRCSRTSRGPETCLCGRARGDIRCTGAEHSASIARIPIHTGYLPARIDL